MPDEVYLVEGLLDPSALWSLYERDRPELKDEPWTPVTQPRLEDADDLFRVVSNGDLLVHHPYDSFETSIEAFIEQAAVDPAVLAIKLALYRTSEESPIVQALVRAAEAGKQVVALVELQARFDERANISAGPNARAGGRARRVRDRRTEDAREGLLGRSTGGRGHPSVHPHRHGELQPEHRPVVRGRGPALGGPGCRGRPERPLQPAHRLQSPATLSTAPGGTRHAQASADRAHPRQRLPPATARSS